MDNKQYLIITIVIYIYIYIKELIINLKMLYETKKIQKDYLNL